jgi:hypothetical protein
MQNSDNPIQTFRWPNEQDPIAQSLHSGKHCLFYDGVFDHSKITYEQKLQDLCNWANFGIKEYGVSGFLKEKNHHYDIANLVKLNIWIHHIRDSGIVKPMLIWYLGNEKYIATNGESRLRVLECIPQITTVTGFISTTAEHKEKFKHLKPVTTFDLYADLCGACKGQEFYFRIANDDAPYGIDWYEFNSEKTRVVTPSEDYCVAAVAEYLKKHPDTEFTPEWFSILVGWNQYKNF